METSSHTEDNKDLVIKQLFPNKDNNVKPEISKKPRKSIASIEISQRELLNLSLPPVVKDESARRHTVLIPNEKAEKTTYAEHYLKTKRSGSLAVPITDLNEKQLKELNEIFKLFDFDQDKYLNKGDLTKLFNSISPKLAKESNVEQFINSAANHDSENINSAQFNNFFGSTYYGRFSRLELKYVFDLLDKNHDGYLDMDDLSIIFESLDWHTKFDLTQVFSSFDTNNDGHVCFEDFKSVMNKSHFF